MVISQRGGSILAVRCTTYLIKSIYRDGAIIGPKVFDEVSWKLEQS